MTFPFEKLRQGIIDIGIEPETYDNFLKVWIDENGDTEQSKKDFIWQCYQELLQSIAKKITPLDEMYRRQRQVYCEMFYFLCREEKPRTVAQKGILNCDIQLAALSGIAFDVKIIITKDCLLSKKYKDKVFTLQEVNKFDILPNMDCKRNGGCICCYGFTAKRDEQDKIILDNI